MLTLWGLQSANVVTAQNASSLLFIAYAIAWFINKEGRYIAAFFFDEVVSNLSLIDSLTEYQYYLVISLIYCFLYWYIEKKNIRLKTIVACAIIILFNAWMSLDAAINTGAETLIYTNYIYIVVLIHLYFISTLFRWKLTRKDLESFTRAFGCASGTSDALAFFWYNSFNNKNHQS